MKKKEKYLKAIDDISFKLYVFEKYLCRYPYDSTGIMIKDRYARMLEKMISEYENLFSEDRNFYNEKSKK